MDEDIVAGLRGDEAVALVGVEPFHGSNRHVLIPPSTVLEVSTHAGPTLAPPAGDKLDPRGAGQTLNTCRAHNRGTANGWHNRGAGHAEQKATAMPGSCLCGSHWGWRAKLQGQLVNVHACVAGAGPARSPRATSTGPRALRRG